MNLIHLIIPGAPRTKKNHGQIFKVDGKPRIMPSPQWEAWRNLAMYPLRQQWTRLKKPSISWPINCKAIFYRDREIGDAVGYYQGLADLLELGGIVKNDKWIVSWDGSRLKKDALHPRIEITLSWEK